MFVVVVLWFCRLCTIFLITYKLKILLIVFSPATWSRPRTRAQPASSRKRKLSSTNQAAVQADQNYVTAIVTKYVRATTVSAATATITSAKYISGIANYAATAIVTSAKYDAENAIMRGKIVKNADSILKLINDGKTKKGAVATANVHCTCHRFCQNLLNNSLH